MQARSAGRRWRQRAVGIFVAYHLLAIVVLSLPSGRTITRRSAWNSRNTRADMRAWAGQLRDFGIDVSDETFRETLWQWARIYGEIRSILAAPFLPYADLVGIRQGWSMFASPQRYPGVVAVDIRKNGHWVPLYRSRSSRYDWRSRQLDHNRMRKRVGRFARSFHRAHWDAFAKQLARWAVMDEFGATEVMVRLLRFHSLPADRVRAGDVPDIESTHERRFDAASLRQEMPAKGDQR